MTPLGAADILDKAAKLLAQGNKDLVFIFHGFCIISRLEDVFGFKAHVGKRES